jgi:multidrug efflux pump subunit AcrB
MSVIPFGLSGAIVGHAIMGFNLSIMSVFGMLALSGVVVNDSLVLVDYINRRRREGMPLVDAVRQAGVARFRAIILTSLTTFSGLLPLMFEKSTQAQFLIPMGISLGWGVLLATFVTLLLVPINYLVLEDLKRLVLRYWRWQCGRIPATPVGDFEVSGK